jgi:large subunit ribosomal protein L24
MATSKIQQGDSVIVISGKFKGTKGSVVNVIPTDKSKRISIDTVTKIAKYKKSNKQYGMPGQMTQIHRTLDISNVMVLDDKGKPSKIAISKKERKISRLFKTTKKPLIKEKLEKEVSKETATTKEVKSKKK